MMKMSKFMKGAISLVCATAMAITMLPQGMGSVATEAATVTLNNPVVAADPTNTIINRSTGEPLLKNTIWDCVYFGSYPQKEVIADEAAYKANETVSHIYYDKEHDVIVDASLYAKLQSASGWDSKNDVVINGNKYHRMKQSDASAVVNNEKTTADKYDSKFYKWADATTYHYFKYEPIKWRVLETKNGQALLYADEAIDDQPYNTEAVATTWETCSLRSYLNSKFIDRAFTAAEASVLQTASLTNENGKGYYRAADGVTAVPYETDGGRATKDKVFILSSNEFRNEAFGFLGAGFFDPDNTYDLAGGIGSYDPTKFCTSSTYVKAMGAYSEDSYWEGCGGNGGLGGCYYCFRTPGKISSWVSHACRYGAEVPRGAIVTTPNRGVRPCVVISLANTSVWSYAGKLSTFKDASDDTHTHVAAAAVNENVVAATCTKEGSYDSVVYCSECKAEMSRKTVTVGKLDHKMSAWTTKKAATVLATGTKTRTCSVCGTVETATIKKVTATIKLSHKTRTLGKNRYFTLKISNLAKGDAVKSVTSSKKSVATVKKYKTNQYRVTTKKKGKTTITVTLKSGKKATCKVTVK